MTFETAKEIIQALSSELTLKDPTGYPANALDLLKEAICVMLETVDEYEFQINELKEAQHGT